MFCGNRTSVLKWKTPFISNYSEDKFFENVYISKLKCLPVSVKVLWLCVLRIIGSLSMMTNSKLKRYYRDF